MEKKQNTFERKVYLDFVKVVALFCVMTIHFSAETTNMFTTGTLIFPAYFFDTAYLGSIGVTMFFIAAGAAAYLSNASNDQFNVALYYKKRFWGIFPEFWISWLIAIVVYLFVFQTLPLAEPGKLLLTLVGQDGYFLALGIVHSSFYIVSEWFLGCIIIIYLISPLLLVTMQKRVWIPIAIAFACVGICYLPFAPTWFSSSLFVLKRIPEFVAGMMFARFINDPGFKCVLGGAVICAVSYAARHLFLNAYYEIILSFGLFVFFSGVYRYISNRPLEQIISHISGRFYSLFLVHHFLIRCMAYRLNINTFGKKELAVLYLGYVFLSFICASLLDRLYAGMGRIFKS